MTNPEQDKFEELEIAIQAIQNQPTGTLSEDLVTSTVEALQDQETVSTRSLQQRRHNRRETMIRLAKYGTLGTAATIMIAMTGSMVITTLTTASAFGQVVENVRKAESASYKLIQKIGSQPVMNFQSSYSGNVIRTEIPGQLIYLADTKERKALQLIPSQKRAIRSVIEGESLEQPLSVADIMKEMTEELGELVETVNQNGKLLDVYKVRELPNFMGVGKLSGDDDFRIWVDQATQLPTRIAVRLEMGPQKTPIAMTFTDFKWNHHFPPGHFEMTIPADYQQ